MTVKSVFSGEVEVSALRFGFTGKVQVMKKRNSERLQMLRVLAVTQRVHGCTVESFMQSACELHVSYCELERLLSGIRGVRYKLTKLAREGKVEVFKAVGSKRKMVNMYRWKK